MKVTGKYNSITDVTGLTAGHFSDIQAASGVTVVICEKGAVAGVDVRGADPGTRETDLLNPINLVEKVQAVMLSGGSVYGLAASDGVVRWLAQKKLGFPVDAEHVVPIAPAAVLYDLGRGADFIPPVQSQWGSKACESAHAGPFEQGCQGAGTGAVSGGIKGGLGTASLVMDSGMTVAAVVAVNSLGSVVNPQTGRLWEKDIEIDDEFKGQTNRSVQLPQADTAIPATNTTIGIVATDAILTKVQATKIAQMAHDGLARAIRPAHTMFDGDTIFCLATGQKELPVGDDFFPAQQAPAINDIGHAAAECMARAILHGILSATTMGSFAAFRDLKDLKHKD